jgi:hypothetical protein
MESQETSADADIHPNGVADGVSHQPVEDEKRELSISKGFFTQAHDVEASSDDDNVVVSTAEEIATKVIHVDDDPTLNPWTFRMFFLGMLGSMALWWKTGVWAYEQRVICILQTNADNNVVQVLACPPLARFCKKYSTSSRKPSMSRWCS